MSDYIIMTDSSCDLPAELAEQLELAVLPLSFVIDGHTYRNLLDGGEIGFHEYYDLLREGKTGSTSAVNIGAFLEAMRPHLDKGLDILYLGFSSGLSATYSASVTAAEQLRTEYPARKVYTVDTLCASLGQGLLLWHTAQQRRQGKSIEEARDFAEQTKLHLCHWFTVDDLMHLKRGGRISSSTALLGTALNIKPVMHMDNAGLLHPVDKERGRKRALKALADRLQQTAVDAPSQPVYISHGDCPEDAQYLADLVREQSGATDFVINHVGPVIGTHTGPGVIALFFLGSER